MQPPVLKSNNLKTSKLWVKVLQIHDLLYFDLHYAKS